MCLLVQGVGRGSVSLRDAYQIGRRTLANKPGTFSDWECRAAP